MMIVIVLVRIVNFIIYDVTRFVSNDFNSDPLYQVVLINITELALVITVT